MRIQWLRTSWSRACSCASTAIETHTHVFALVCLCAMEKLLWEFSFSLLCSLKVNQLCASDVSSSLWRNVDDEEIFDAIFHICHEMYESCTSMPIPPTNINSIFILSILFPLRMWFSDSFLNEARHKRVIFVQYGPIGLRNAPVSTVIRLELVWVRQFLLWIAFAKWPSADNLFRFYFWIVQLWSEQSVWWVNAQFCHRSHSNNGHIL